MTSIRFLHTSDIHVGCERLPGLAIPALRDVVGLANRLEVDALLVAGDLFDHARVVDGLIHESMTLLGQVACPIVIAPGNHDLTSPGSIYDRIDIRRAGEHVYLTRNPEGEHIELIDEQVAVWGRGFESHDPSFRPLAGFRRHPEARLQIALAHGHFRSEVGTDQRSSPILAEDLSTLNCDYVALGHWHHFQDVSQGQVVAAYSGSPSDVGSGTATANLLVASTGESQASVRVERVPIA